LYAGEEKNKIFDSYAALKERLIKAIEKTVDYYHVNARFTLRVGEERMANIVFEPAMLKFRRISAGTSVTISGDPLHIAVAEFPDVTEKVEKINEKLAELGEPPVQVPDPNSPGEYIKNILDIYERIENKGIRVKLP